MQPELTYNISKEGIIYATNPEEEVAEDVEVARLLLRDASATELEKMRTDSSRLWVRLLVILKAQEIRFM